MLANYSSAEKAVADGAFVTHFHPCGHCSTLQDLSVYMKHWSLGESVRICALKMLISMKWARECLMDLGFTADCATIWLYNAGNTRKECFGVCMKALWDHTPNNVPPNSTKLNDCLQCDEDKSGPVFKRSAGRTRRDSGLSCAINRPPESIYPVTHYYY